LKTLVFALMVGSILGAVDYLFGLFYGIYEMRAEGLWVLLRGFLWGQVLYCGLGLGFGVLTISAVALFRLGISEAGPKKLSLSGHMLGGMAGLFAIFLLETFAQIHTDWKLFLDFVFFVPIGVGLGFAVRMGWENYLKDFLGSALRGILLLDLAAIFSAMFASLWVLRFPVSTIGKLAMLVLSAAVFLVSVFSARSCFRKKSRGLITAYALYGFIFLCLPVLGYRSPEKSPSLGSPKNPVNIIFILADACRPDALGIYGSANPTPNIDRLAREGALFKNTYAQAPWTLPSMLSILSSLNPSVFKYGEPYHAGPEIEFFPERLKACGYSTEAVLANFLLAGSSGILQGLDREVTLRHRYRLQKLVHLPVTMKTCYLLRRLLGLSQIPDNTAMITAEAEKFFQNPKQPFFLWLHYMNPHDPYNPPEKYLKQVIYKGFLKPPFYPNDPYHLPEDFSHPQELELRLGYVFLHKKDKEYIHNLYLAQLRYLDDKIGELRDALKAKGLDKNTLIVFASDHGEEFWEHDQQGHGCGLYDELTHTVLILWGAGIKPGVVEPQVEMLDLVPTLADLLGISANPAWQGKSFAQALIAGGKNLESRPAFAEGMHRPEEMQMIRAGDYKLIIGLYTGKKWLFNLKQDPGEQKNIYDQNPGVARELESRLAEWSAHNYSLRARFQTRELSPEEKKEIEERLRAAGYIK